MRVLMCIGAALALAVGFSLTSASEADATCRVGFRCNSAVLVPAPNPIPLRRARPRIVAPKPCVGRCGVAAVPAVRAPCVGACGVPAPRQYLYQSRAFYAYYKQPAYGGDCNGGSCNTYWRRDCWYDSFGRRFCN